MSEHLTDKAVGHPQGTEAFERALARLNPFQKEAVSAVDGPVLVIAGPGTGKTQVLAARIAHLLLHPDLQLQPENILALTYTEAGTVAMRQRLISFAGPVAHRVAIHTFHGYCNELLMTYPDVFNTRDFEAISDLDRMLWMRKMLDDLPNDHQLKRYRGDLYTDVPRLQHLFHTMKSEDWSPDIIHKNIDSYLADLPQRDEYIYKRGNAKKGIAAGDPNTNKIKLEEEKMNKLRAAADLFPVYEKMMQDGRRYDYADMILWTLRAFKDNPSFLQSQQERFPYFLVDEYQDTNGAQNDVLQILTSFWDKPDVFVVGDDDQSIYRFQGANVKNILAFHQQYESDIRTIVLTENYRSSQPILDTAMHLIGKNHERLIRILPGLEKNLQAALSHEREFPRVIECHNPQEEIAALVAKIEQLHASGEQLNDIAVIYRKHRSSEDLVRILDHRGIPYNTSRKINVLQLPIIRQLITIIDYVTRENNKVLSGESLLYEILHYRFIGLPQKDVFRLSVEMASKNKPRSSWRALLNDHLWLAGIDLEHVEAWIEFDRNLETWITSRHDLPLTQWVEQIVKESGLMNTLLTSPYRVWMLEALNTFFGFIRSESEKNRGLRPEELLEIISLMVDHRLDLSLEKTIHHASGVNLLTAHGSKGLEFKHVFVIGSTKDHWESGKGSAMYQFSFPDTLTLSSGESDMEENRRLFYVAMTRAKERLTLSYSTHNGNRETERCRFLDEILEIPEVNVQPPEITDEEKVRYHAELLTPPPGNPGDSEQAHIAGLVENYVMNVTHLNRYIECPVAFFYEYILRVPRAENENMAFGTVIHNALRRLFDKIEKEGKGAFPPEDILISAFRDEMQKKQTSFTSKQFDNRMHYGEECLKEYYSTYATHWNKTVVTEYHIRNVEISGVPVNGTLDKIEFQGNNIHVVDYKTGRYENARTKLKPPDDKDPRGGNYWRQLVFYKLLVDADKRTSWVMRSGEIDFIEKDSKDQFRKVRFDISHDDEQMVLEQIHDTYEKIRNQEFSRGCDSEDCNWCRLEREKNLFE
ncbi:MAG: ATP-dependent helicase [Flavobacteriales bacterium]|nr:ATP-dependent helicase [Flavobacteriales bacterium]